MQDIGGVLALISAFIVVFCMGYNTGRRSGFEQGKRAGMFRARQSVMSQK